MIDEGVAVGDAGAFATCRALARRIGLLVGGTAGGAIRVALDRLDTFPGGSTAVVLVSDAGEKYLDTIFDDRWLAEHGLHDPDEEERVIAGLDELRRTTELPTEGVA